jgi:hypothetical protein
MKALPTWIATMNQNSNCSSAGDNRDHGMRDSDSRVPTSLVETHRRNAVPRPNVFVSTETAQASFDRLIEKPRHASPPTRP